MFHVNVISCSQIMRSLNQPTNFFLKQRLGLYLGSKNILGVQCWDYWLMLMLMISQRLRASAAQLHLTCSLSLDRLHFSL
jgi:hypothetical protein